MLGRLREFFGNLGQGERPGTRAQGDAARAIVTYFRGDIEPGMRNRYFTKYVTLRLADDPEDGPTTEVQVYLQREAHRAVRLGTEMPVVLAPGTRSIIGIDADRFEAEAGVPPA